MARIETYNKKQAPLDKDDKWIGTDSSGQSTKNFGLSGVGTFLGITDHLTVAGQVVFKWQDSAGERKPGYMGLEGFGGSDTNLADLTEFVVSSKNFSETYILDYLNILQGERVIITEVGNHNNFVIADISAIFANPIYSDYSTVAIDVQAGNGTIAVDAYYAIGIYAGEGNPFGGDEDDTLASVTARGSVTGDSITTGGIISNGVSQFRGDLTVDIGGNTQLSVDSTGEVVFESLTTALIDAEVTGRIATTKEWVEAQNYLVPGSVPTLYTSDGIIDAEREITITGDNYIFFQDEFGLGDVAINGSLEGMRFYTNVYGFGISTLDGRSSVNTAIGNALTISGRDRGIKIRPGNTGVWDTVVPGQVLTALNTDGLVEWQTPPLNTDTQLTDAEIAAFGYIKDYTETDPVFLASDAFHITSTEIANWNIAFGWGNHANEGYLTDYTVTEADVTNHESAITITESQISDLTHVTNNNQLINGAGYITSFTDTQLTAEQVQDIMGATWISGTNNTFVYDDANNTLQINSVDTNTTYSNLSEFTNDVGYVTQNTQLSDEQVQDIVGAFISGSGATSITYLDALNSLVISSTDTIADGSETIINQGTNITISGSGTSGSPYVINSTDTNDNDNDYVDSASFNSSNGDFTLGRTGVLSDIIVNLDGRYLTAETDNQTLTWTPGTNALSISGGNSQTINSFGSSVVFSNAVTFEDDVEMTNISAGIMTVDGGGMLSSITNSSANWNTAFGWGDHSTAGYITSFDITTQTDPKYLRSDVADLKTSGNLTFKDNVALVLGTGADALLYQNGSENRLQLNANDFAIRDGGANALRFTFERTTGDFIATGGVEAQGALHTFGSSSSSKTTINIEAPSTTSSPATAVEIIQTAHGGRGNGTFYKDTSFTGEEWFAGMTYQGNFNKWGIGYDSTGGQSEYLTNEMFSVSSSGDINALNNATFGGEIKGSNYLRLTDTLGAEKTSIRVETNYTTEDHGTRSLNTFANTHHFWRGANEIMRIHSNSNVGIGTVNPSAKLEVNGTVDINYEGDSVFIATPAQGQFILGDTNGISSEALIEGTGNELLFKNDGNTTMVTTNLNRVGIGTTSPSTKLEVVGTISSGAGAGASQLGMDFGGLLTPASLPSQVRGVIGALDSGTGIAAGSIGYQPRTGVSASHIFFTEQNEKMRIDSDGNVGIGTASPGVKLHVAGDTGELLRLDDSSATGNPFMSFYQVGTRRSLVQHVDSGDMLSLVSEYGGIRMMTGTGGTEVNRFQINNSGRVMFARQGITGSMTASIYDVNITGDDFSDKYLNFWSQDGTNSPRAWLKHSSSATAQELEFNGTFATGSGYADFAFRRGTTPIMFLDQSNQHVGIGTETPASRLHTYSATENVTATFESGDADSWINIKDNASGTYGVLLGATGDDFIIAPNNSEKMRITSVGNVGIGTDSPTYKLSVADSVNNGDVGISITNSFDDNLATSEPNAVVMLNAASNNCYLRVHGAPADTASKHQIDLGSTAGNSFLTFSPSGSERMRITSTGNVGIGTETPGFDLDVTGDSGIRVSSGSDLPLRVVSTDGTCGIEITDNTHTYYAFTTSDDFRIRSATDGNTDRLTIQGATGNVGIGTTSPSTKLEVVGDIKASSVNGIYRTSITLTAAQILAITTTPIEVIPAPGAGKLISIINMSAFLDYNTTAYSTGQLRVQGPSRIYSVTPAGFLTSTKDAYSTGVSGGSAAGEVNTALVISAAANPTSGNSPVTIKLVYEIVDFN